MLSGPCKQEKVFTVFEGWDGKQSEVNNAIMLFHKECLQSLLIYKALHCSCSLLKMNFNYLMVHVRRLEHYNMQQES